MSDTHPFLLNQAQQRIYVDAIFAMAALDGFEIVGTTGIPGNDRPMMCAKQMGNYRVQISWVDEQDIGPDATKATWEIEVNQRHPCVGDGWSMLLVQPALHASDALRIAKGLVGFHHALTQRSSA
jgi:hypothetical protein